MIPYVLKASMINVSIILVFDTPLLVNLRIPWANNKIFAAKTAKTRNNKNRNDPMPRNGECSNTSCIMARYITNTGMSCTPADTTHHKELTRFLYLMNWITPAMNNTIAINIDIKYSNREIEMLANYKYSDHYDDALSLFFSLYDKQPVLFMCKWILG